MSFFDRIGSLVQPSKDTKGAIGRDKNGVEIWNRNGDNALRKIFPESSSLKNRQKNWTYYFYPAETRFEDNYVEDKLYKTKVIEEKGGIFTSDDFFSTGVTILELGCGGGQTAIDLARKYRGRGINYLAIDHEMGEEIPVPVHFLPNLNFINADWKNLDLKDESVDRIMSLQGVARYGGEEAAKEVTRVAKEGAIFRGDEDRGVYGRRNFSDHLYEMGWNVWKLKDTTLIVAQKVKTQTQI